jgi:hypothetical protein
MTVIALLGTKALWLVYIWLGSAIIASLISDRKGYGERPGLATGIMLSAIALIIWLIVPARKDSRWKLQGPFGRRGGGKTVAEMRADTPGDGGEG